jgi:ABC-2 type transport system permease protein
MTGSPQRRVWAIVYRHLALYRRSWPRVFELMYWPSLQMLVWGFVSAWLATLQPGAAQFAAGVLLGGVLLWEVALRSQMGFAISFLEDIWSRNLGHVFVSPIRPTELIMALISMSLLRTLAGVLPAAGLAWLFYGFGLFDAGPVIVAFFALLLMMGWAVALGVTALILRHGAGAEALAWGVLFGVTPFAAVFYPVSTLPLPMQFIALSLPAAHVFEGLRAALIEGRTAWEHLVAALALNLAWMAALGGLFLRQFEGARERGALLTIGE